MGYLIKSECTVTPGNFVYHIFYSEPVTSWYIIENGQYLSVDEYEAWMKDPHLNKYEYEYVTNDGWLDPAESYGMTRGIEVSEFVADCILQGVPMELEKPVEFGVMSARSGRR